jgi:hypothetical protein
MIRARVPLPLLLVLGLLSALAGCRRVTVISFHTDSPPPQIDELVVQFSGIKGPLTLRGLDEEIGLYNLPGDRIEISAWACFKGKIVLSNRGAIQPYPIVADRVPVTLSVDDDERDSTCPMVLGDGSVSGIPGIGAGGAAGMGEMGGATGSGGGGTDGGASAGGANGCGGLGGGGAAGTTDAGAGGNGGAGGVTGAGGCDDAGAPVDAGFCEPPPDPAPTPPSVTPGAGCEDYCNRIVGPRDGGGALCPGTYPDVASCVLYCTLAAWPQGTTADAVDNLGCRYHYLSSAEGTAGPGTTRTMSCAAAGPTGGLHGECGSNTCVTFCDALAGICGSSAPDCMRACGTGAPPQSSCRFNWLQRASSDPRYCHLIDFSSSCVISGC